MKSIVVALVLLSTSLASASIVTLLDDNFDFYLDKSEVTMIWAGTPRSANVNGGLADLIATDRGMSVSEDNGTLGRSMSTGIAPTTGTDDNPIKFSFMFKDLTGTGNLRQFASIRDYEPSASNQLLAIGAYNSATDRRTGLAATAAQLNTYYAARVAFGTGAPAWFILNGDGAPTRSAGWHELSIVIKSQKLDFLVDGVSAIQNVAPVQNFNLAAGLTFDTVVVGSGLSSANGGAYYDDVKVQVLPEPVSLVLLGLGGLFLRRRRA